MGYLMLDFDCLAINIIVYKWVAPAVFIILLMIELRLSALFKKQKGGGEIVLGHLLH